MKASSNTKEKTHQNHRFKEESSFQSLSTTVVSRFFYLTFIATITNISLHLIFNNKSINFSNDVHEHQLQQDLNRVRVDPKWLGELSSIDYAVFSSSHWFYSQNHLHENGCIIGCVRCHYNILTSVEPGRGIGPAFRATLRAVNGCGKKIVTFVQTFSPAHFEHGNWKTGGRGTRTRPLKEEEVDRAQNGWGYRKIQLEEVEIARAEGMWKGNEFEVLDVMEMMVTRADGYPGRFWSSEHSSDCLHWCLPGPVDMRNWLLLEKVKRLDSISSDTILLYNIDSHKKLLSLSNL